MDTGTKEDTADDTKDATKDGTEDDKDLNATIVTNEEAESTSSIWEGILGLVEDIDTKFGDVSIVFFSLYVILF